MATNSSSITSAQSASRSPFVYWAQDKESVFLRVEIRDAHEINVKIFDKNLLDFSAISGNGQQYGFCIKLAASVENNPSVKRSDAKIDVTLTKTDKQCDFWPFLLAESGPASRPAWLKFDFDRWQDEEDDTEEEDSDLKKLAEEGALENQYAELMEKYKGRTMTPDEVEKRLNLLYGTYLFGYNICIFMAHFYVLSCLLHGYFTQGNVYLQKYWSLKYSSFMTCTMLQYLDVLHALGGLTKSDWQTNTLQVSGRVAVLWIIDGNPEIHTWLPVFALIVNYLMVEQFRYPYYALNSMGITIRPIAWLRYNMWMLFYPVGFILEAVIFIKSVPFYHTNEKYSISMPNALNFSFNFGTLLAVFTTTLFPFIAYTLLKHMFRQRTKNLAKEKSASSTKKYQ